MSAEDDSGGVPVAAVPPPALGLEYEPAAKEALEADAGGGNCPAAAAAAAAALVWEVATRPPDTTEEAEGPSHGVRGLVADAGE